MERKIYEKLMIQKIFKNDTNLFEMLIIRKVMSADMDIL